MTIKSSLNLQFRCRPRCRGHNRLSILSSWFCSRSDDVYDRRKMTRHIVVQKIQFVVSGHWRIQVGEGCNPSMSPVVWAIALFTVPRPYHASVKSHLASDWLQVRRGSSAAETELAVAYSRLEVSCSSCYLPKKCGPKVITLRSTLVSEVTRRTTYFQSASLLS